jgi:hypothetical protein
MRPSSGRRRPKYCPGTIACGTLGADPSISFRQRPGQHDLRGDGHLPTHVHGCVVDQDRHALLVDDVTGVRTLAPCSAA